MSEGQAEISDVSVTITIGPVTITINGKVSSIDSIIEECIAAAKKNESRIKDLLENFGSIETSNQKVTRSTSPTTIKTSIAGSGDSYEDIVEVIGDTVKFVAKNAYDLSTKEAVGLLMYFWHKPLQPKDAEEMLAKAWKRVNNLRNYFVDKRELKQHVIKTDEGYVLTGNGRRWVEGTVIPKIRGEVPTES